MLFYTTGQIYIFLATILAGIAVGAWYDMLCPIRCLCKAKLPLSLAADIVFGLGAGAIVTACLYAAAYGEVRLYSLMGIACGCILYFGTVSRLLHAAAKKLCPLLHRIQKNFQKN